MVLQRASLRVSRSGDNYSEAVERLQARFIRPRLIHQTHVRMIMELLPSRMGPARNYVVYTTRCNSTFVLSRPWAMSLLVHSSSSYWSSNWTRTPCLSGNNIVRGQLTFLTSPIKLLEFMNLRAQASETSLSNHKGSSRGVNPSDRKSHHPPKPITTFTSNADPSSNCILCGTSKHPLYACTTFKSVPHEMMLSTLTTSVLTASNQVILCVNASHFRCQKPHHSLLHVEPKDSPSTQPSTQPSLLSVSPVTSSDQVGRTAPRILWVGVVPRCHVTTPAPFPIRSDARARTPSLAPTPFSTRVCGVYMYCYV